MSREAQIEAIKKAISVSEQTLEDLHSKANLLNKTIPELEDELAQDKARLQKLEEGECTSKGTMITKQGDEVG